MRLLTRSNPKLDKSIKYGYHSFGVHLAPGQIAGINVCPNASKGCLNSCLSTAGFGRYNRVQQARIKKTKLFHAGKETFLRQLKKEINAKVNTSKKKGHKVSFRLNLTSDIAWENQLIDGKNLMDHFPEVQFLDYTKSLKRMINHCTGNFPKNYHLTFSRSESNDNACKIVMGMKGNIAVVFDKKLPKSYHKSKVVDGVKNDLTFLHKKGSILGLIALGKARKDKSGFVIKTRP